MAKSDIADICTHLPDPADLFPAALRLARRVDGLQDALDAHLVDPMDRALAGVGPVPDDDGELRTAVLGGLARLDGGRPPSVREARLLAERAVGDLDWWVPSARLHALVDQERERSARSALAGQSLPYVFLGEFHPLMVDVLACGERILPALHVDWLRRLTRWISPALILDCRHRGLWFWPVLEVLDSRQLVRPLARLADARRMPTGALGVAGMYCNRVGAAGQLMVERGTDTDRWVMAVAAAGTCQGPVW